MKQRVFICPDKFKGTLTATEAAQAIAKGWRQARPDDLLDLLPVSDGGDGFGELLGRHLGAEELACETVDAAHRPIRAAWWWAPARRVAIIESARVIGLAMLPRGQFHPRELDTFGLGAVLRAAEARRPRQLLLGIGGSATNDAGFGLARALGWQFLDREGASILRWPELTRLGRIVAPKPDRRRLCPTVAVDVRNRLLGPRGATRVYGPQKGLQPADLTRAERALGRLARVFANRSVVLTRLLRHAGTGAAGGLGFGIAAFAHGHLVPGFELFARSTDFTARLWRADVVVTGEGAIDETSVSMGKGVGQIARRCRQARKPCIGLAGVVKLDAHQAERFTHVAGIVPKLTSPEQAMSSAASWLATLAREVAASCRTE